ncbi:hypothetical protein J6590_025902 [Homalodisca vitripennis]|nr:hypothetical protein J6590_025902 [Homalodisca vitripennis]
MKQMCLKSEVKVRIITQQLVPLVDYICKLTMTATHSVHGLDSTDTTCLSQISCCKLVLERSADHIGW